jgi:outer membrane protein assembly factor BamB
MRLRPLVGGLGVVLAAGLVFAGPEEKTTTGDWPCWRGPERTGLSPETGLLKEWPAGGPKLLWKATGLGGGFSTPSLAAGHIYLLGTKEEIKGRRGGGPELLIALDANGGKRLWDTPVGTVKGGHPGPRSTPTVDGDRVYALSSDGTLICATTDKGEVVWKIHLIKDLGGRHGSWAYAESPLIDGDKLICTPGGEEASLAALEKKTGKVIWKCSLAHLKGKPDRRGRQRPYQVAGYSSPIVTEIDGVRQYIQFVSGGVVGVAAKDGALLWHYEAPANGTANCSTPLFRPADKGGYVFAASGYGTGGGMARVTRDGDTFRAEEVFFVRQLQNHHGGMVQVGDHIYGTNNSSLLCVDSRTGDIVWQNRCVGKGSVAYADGHLIVRSERGPVALVEATPAGYKEKGRFRQPDRSEQRSWPHPVIAGGRLYLRDWDVLLCYDMKSP